MKILLIEDESVTQDLIKQILKDYPCVIETAQTFAQGLLQKNVFKPEIILLDCKLPDSSEVTLKRNIQALNHDSAVVLLTGYLKPETFIEAKEAGAQATFHKDILVKPEQFISELTKVWYSFKMQGKNQNNKSSSQSLALTRADIPQSEILYVLHQQNLNQDQTNLKLFDKLDQAAEASHLAKDAAKLASDKADDAAKIGLDVKNQFIALNGSVKDTIKRVASLEGIRELEIKEEEKRKYIKEGIWIIPKQIAFYVNWAAKIIKHGLSVFGFLAMVWLFVKHYLLHLP